MSTDLFYPKRINPLDDRFSNIYIEYLIDSYFFKLENKMDFQELYKSIFCKYSNEVKSTNIKKYIRKYVGKVRSKTQWANEHSAIFISKALHEAESIQSHNGNNRILQSINMSNASDSLGIEVFKYIYSENKDEPYLPFRIYKYLKLRQEHCEELKLSISTVDQRYNNVSLMDVLNLGEKYSALLWKCQLDTISSLKNRDPLLLVDIFCCEIMQFLNLLSFLKASPNEIVKKCFQSVNETSKKILNYRLDLNQHNDSMTLEEVGNLYNLTRERIRQIEKKATLQIKNNVMQVVPSLNAMFICMDCDSNNYISLSDLKNSLKNDDLLEDFLICYYLGNFNIKYNKDFCILYNSNYISLDILVDGAMDTLGDYFDIRNISSDNPLISTLININFRKISNHLYIKKGINKSDMFVRILKEKFAKGFRINNEHDYDELKNYCVNDGYSENDIPTQRSIAAYVERSSMMPIDRGVYADEKYIPKIPDDLLNTIYTEIMNEGVVYYSAIEDRHKKELEELGINNQYMLKGIIDTNLPSEFVRHHHYISYKSNTLSPFETITNFIRGQNELFTMNDLQEKFKGVKNYIFETILNKEIKNGLIRVSQNAYKYFSCYHISDNQKELISNEIIETFKTTGEHTVSSSKVFARIYLKNKQLLDDIGLIGRDFELFSLIKHMFNDYYYSRPLISESKDTTLTTYELIKNYVTRHNEVNMNLISEYYNKMSIQSLYSYLEFMNDLSDDYVQVSRDTIVKKEAASMSESLIREVNSILKIIFYEMQSINTKEFDAYYLFPKTRYKWNKYLLAGIVRSYLSEEYYIECTTGNYKTTDFIIRRIKK